MSTKYQVHVIHIVRPQGQHKGDRNVFDVWCDTRNQAEAWLRRHLKDMRGRTTQVHGDIRQVEVVDEEEHDRRECLDNDCEKHDDIPS